MPQGLILSLVLLLCGVLAFVLIWRRPQQAWRIAGATAIVMIVGVSGLLLIYRQGDARYDKYDMDRFLKPMMADLAKAARCQRQGLKTVCEDVFVMPDPTLTDYFLNYLAAPLPWYSLEAKQVDTPPGQAPYRTLWADLAWPRPERADRRPGGPPRLGALADRQRLQAGRDSDTKNGPGC